MKKKSDASSPRSEIEDEAEMMILLSTPYIPKRINPWGKEILWGRSTPPKSKNN